LVRHDRNRIRCRPAEIIVGVDVVLRPWTIDDAAALHAAVTTSPDLAHQLGDADLGTVASCAGYIERFLAQPSDDRVDRAVCSDGIDGIALGNVGLSHIDHRHDTAWTYYWVTAGHRRRGLAGGALAAMATYGFEELDLFRIELGHRVDNVASCRVATRAGFASEGIERSKLRYGDLRYDVETHARLATDPSTDPSIRL
jgi:ribosomal-protein-alanine N-acetyltransferase